MSQVRQHTAATFGSRSFQSGSSSQHKFVAPGVAPGSGLDVAVALELARDHLVGAVLCNRSAGDSANSLVDNNNVSLCHQSWIKSCSPMTKAPPRAVPVAVAVDAKKAEAVIVMPRLPHRWKQFKAVPSPLCRTWALSEFQRKTMQWASNHNLAARAATVRWAPVVLQPRI